MPAGDLAQDGVTGGVEAGNVVVQAEGTGEGVEQPVRSRTPGLGQDQGTRGPAATRGRPRRPTGSGP